MCTLTQFVKLLRPMSPASCVPRSCYAHAVKALVKGFPWACVTFLCAKGRPSKGPWRCDKSLQKSEVYRNCFRVRPERPDGDGRCAQTVLARPLKFWPKKVLGWLQVATKDERPSPGQSRATAVQRSGCTSGRKANYKISFSKRAFF